jgi:phospholipid/cholesterol/gamma-HCH transport system permease protein
MKRNSQISTFGSLPFQITQNLLEFLGYTVITLGGAIRSVKERPFPKDEFRTELFRVGVESLGIILVTGLFTGMVLAVQGGVSLERFGARSLLGNAITATLLRELGPSLTALLVAGRVGSGFASELATMVITDQVEALRAMGFDPRQILVLPRLLAITLMTPILAIYFSLCGLFGGMIMAVTTQHFTPLLYFQSIVESMRIVDLWGGMLKGAVFGFLIGSLSLSIGLRTRGGSEAVGTSTKEAVVISSVTILVADFFLAQLLVGFYQR